MNARRALDATAGFTLLEAMLSLALTAAIVSALATVTAHGRRRTTSLVISRFGGTISMGRSSCG
jgi:type II secretory pathway component PulJ